MKTISYIALGLAFAAVAFGETRVTGTVTDESGAAISGAMIPIHWDSAGITVGLRSNIGIRKDLVLTTDARGSVSVELPPGFYDLFVSAMAFTPTCRKIRLNAVATSEFRFRLAVDPKVIQELGDRISGKR
jgi:hypothetical protein